MLTPYHKVGEKLMTFDYIVSNPPFKLDFSDYVADLDGVLHVILHVVQHIKVYHEQVMTFGRLDCLYKTAHLVKKQDVEVVLMGTDQ